MSSHFETDNESERKHLRKVRAGHIGQLTKQINEGMNLLSEENNGERILQISHAIEITLRKIHAAHIDYVKELSSTERIGEETSLYATQEFRVIEFKSAAKQYLDHQSSRSTFARFAYSSEEDERSKHIRRKSKSLREGFHHENRSLSELEARKQELTEEIKRVEEKIRRSEENSGAGESKKGNAKSKRQVTADIISPDPDVLTHQSSKPVTYEALPLSRNDLMHFDPIQVKQLFSTPVIFPTASTNNQSHLPDDKILLQTSTRPPSLVDVPPSGSESLNHIYSGSVDRFIDGLIEGRETVLPESNYSGTEIGRALQESSESRNLPTIELVKFDGNPAKWPDFIENFRSRVHMKSTFTDNTRMERLISVLQGEVKRNIETLGTSGIFYATALKTLKRDYGNPVLVCHLKLNEIFNKPQINYKDRISLKAYGLELKSCVMWLESMNYEFAINSTENVTKAVMRLPLSLRQSFYRSSYQPITGLSTDINLKNFSLWLEKKLVEFFNPIADVIATVERSSLRIKTVSQSSIKGIGVNVNHNHYQQPRDEKRTCWVCFQNHRLMECRQFKDSSIADRKQTIMKQKLCFNCMAKGHTVNECSSVNRCKVCHRKHHTLLHDSTPENNGTQTGSSINSLFKPHRTLLQILPVTIINGRNSIKTNAFLDPGSDSTLISRDIATKINLRGATKMLKMSNVITETISFQSKQVNFKLTSEDHPEGINIDGAWIVDSLNLPTNTISGKDLRENYQHLRDIKLPILHSSEVGILIGADMPHLLIQSDCRVGKTGQPVAVKTTLGWVVMGGRNPCNHAATNSISIGNTEEISTLLRRFWEVDSYGTIPKNNKSLLPETERKSLTILEKTTKWNGNRYQVGLLWKEDEPNLPYNRNLAVQRLASTERKLQRNPELLKRYNDTVRDYFNKGHASYLPPFDANNTTSITNYIPHHSVTNVHKPNKVRIVFDAAAKYRDTCLNEKLHPGPDLLSNLVSVLLRFRQGKYAAIADIEQMFHQILVREIDRDALRFVWRENPDEPIKDCQMNVHIFGKVDSPCIANWTVKRCAVDNKDNHSLQTFKRVTENFYMDDFLPSDVSIKQLQIVVLESIEMLKKGGFRLTKWIANHHEIMEALPRLEQSPSISEPLTRVLGVVWNHVDDNLSVQSSIKSNHSQTKRGILSLVSGIYDPLGILTPYLLEAKLIIQELWRLKIDWDENLPDKLLSQYATWKSSLNSAFTIQIPRWFGWKGLPEEITELHVFADASVRAYGAVGYLRVKDGKKVTVTFVMGKSRLAPIKPMTVPKLELQAAVTASRLKEAIFEGLSSISVHQTYFWTDSITVLRYINNKERRFPNHVTHRVNEIKDNSSPSDWNYVPGRLNPADISTRPIKTVLESLSLWTCGPAFLFEQVVRQFELDSLKWPEEHSSINLIDSTPETHQVVCWNKYSSWYRLVRSFAYIVKLKRQWLDVKRKRERHSTFAIDLQSEDVDKGEQAVLKFAQMEMFPKEYLLLSQNQALERSSIVTLKPIFYNELLRVGGRIKHAAAPFDTKHQIILSHKHPATGLLLHRIHLKHHHPGINHLISLSRTKYWITHVKSICKRVVRECQHCKKMRVKPIQPMMGDLPPERLRTHEHPFTYAGVDYFGPITVKVSKNTRRNKATNKRYGVLFTCLTVRACHLELANDLSTDSFLMALKRFKARRGQPKTIWSDNGTNFVGADHELAQLVKDLDQRKIGNFTVENNITWKFNPPASPWMGGAWESLVKLTKRCLRTITRDRLYTEEALVTILCEIEAILNSRPITSTSDDVKDYEALTPQHFLSKRYEVPLDSFADFNMCMRQKWKTVTAAANLFWERFSKEYITELNLRRKWTKVSENLSEGDLVLLQTENTPRTFWPMARITKTYPGKDSVVRSVAVRKADGTIIKRPTSKLCLLEKLD